MVEIKQGLISVIMSNYNTPEEYLRYSIESILNQTYNYFEFIIIDDCSTDSSVEIIKSYNDPRIVLIQNEINSGLTKSLNNGLSVAQGEFIARMDSDDYSYPKRFQKQIEYMNSHPDTIVCGTWINYFGEGAAVKNNSGLYRVLPDRETMKIQLLFDNSTNIVHPTAMFRHKMLLDNNLKYNEAYKFAQDYRMWVDCCRIGTCYNLPEVLLKYRVHNKSITGDKSTEQAECAKNIMIEQLSWLGLEKPNNFDLVHIGLLSQRKKYCLEIKQWINIILSANKKYKIYNNKLLKRMLMKKWAEISYFGLYSCKGITKLKVLLNLSVLYYPELIRIKINRAKKKGK